MKSHFLYPSQWVVFKTETVVSTVLGSCVAVVLFDPTLKVGGMNHYLLPEPLSMDPENPRYGTIAIAQLVAEMKRSGVRLESLQAKVFGGGNVIASTMSGPSIGDLNIAVAEKALAQLRIPIVEKNVGGSRARSIKFNSATFDVIHLFVENSNKVA
ncbi:MAG: chemotaxis protein CheD [Bdellovibrionaceae bacterium]|nr:chemotaxis protein CheD [Pseudobdellovibrionaceae bacterium]